MILREGAPLSEESFARIPADTRAWMREQNGIVAMSFERGTTADWHRVVAPVVRHFDIVSTDWGALSLPDATDAALTGHVVCVAGSWERDSAESAIAFARAAEAQLDDCRAIVVLSDIAGRRSSWPRQVTPRLPIPLLAFRHDAAMAAGRAPARTTMTMARAMAAAVRRAGFSAEEQM
ncbi:hypothetical protein [Microbacterium sp. LWH10-1.2]|uniref:hypothetical protein n=1 Tax=unclassified Microbacterium TaxID=2609290 RepID=UPI003139023F